MGLTTLVEKKLKGSLFWEYALMKHSHMGTRNCNYGYLS